MRVMYINVTSKRPESAHNTVGRIERNFACQTVGLKNEGRPICDMRSSIKSGNMPKVPVLMQLVSHVPLPCMGRSWHLFHKPSHTEHFCRKIGQVLRLYACRASADTPEGMGACPLGIEYSLLY